MRVVETKMPVLGKNSGIFIGLKIRFG